MSEDLHDDYRKGWSEGYDEGFEDGVAAGRYAATVETGWWVAPSLIFALSGTAAGAVITALFILIGG